MAKSKKNTASKNFRIVVDTTAYAGNFERQSIAYATGLVGECGVGQEEAQKAQEELPEDILAFWEDHGLSLADDSGCHRPASIYPTPGFFNHGLGGGFPLTAEGRAAGLIDYRKQVDNWVDRDREQLARVQIGQGGWTQEAIDNRKLELDKRLEDAKALTAVIEHPSYQSVAIVCDEQPGTDVLASFEARMRDYFANGKMKGIEILDIVVETEVVRIETKRDSILKKGAPRSGPTP